MVGSVFVDRDFFFSGRILLLFVFLVLHCSLCRASVFSHVLILDMCSKIVMLVSAACIGLLIGTVRPIPGSCANQVIIFVEKEGFHCYFVGRV